jgi:hypothetical protein
LSKSFMYLKLHKYLLFSISAAVISIWSHIVYALPKCVLYSDFICWHASSSWENLEGSALSCPQRIPHLPWLHLLPFFPWPPKAL